MDITRCQPDNTTARPLTATASVTSLSAARERGSAATGGVGGGSRYEISPQARQMAHIANLAREAPAVREDKVEEMKARLASGDYKVDLEKLADHLAKVL